MTCRKPKEEKEDMVTQEDRRYWCCECIHYIHGQLNQPCAKGSPYVGYLNEGCHRWENKDGLKKPRITHKICSVCGKSLPVSEFYRNKDNKDRLTNACKTCKPRWVLNPEREKEKEARKDKKTLTEKRSPAEWQCIPVVSVDKDGNHRVYPSAKAATAETGVKRSSIAEVCKGNRFTAGGLKWYYLEQWQKMNK